MTPAFLSTPKIATWALSALSALGLFIIGSYTKGISETLDKHDERITNAAVELYHVEQDIAIANAKMDMLLQAQGLRYNGPEFKDHAAFHNEQGPKVAQ